MYAYISDDYDEGNDNAYQTTSNASDKFFDIYFGDVVHLHLNQLVYPTRAWIAHQKCPTNTAIRHSSRSVFFQMCPFCFTFCQLNFLINFFGHEFRNEWFIHDSPVTIRMCLEAGIAVTVNNYTLSVCPLRTNSVWSGRTVVSKVLSISRVPKKNK